MHYAVKLSDPMTIRAFSNAQAAKDHSRGYYVFQTADDLAAHPLTADELMGIHWLAAGYETNVKDRIYLCDLILEKIEALNLTPVDAIGKSPVQAEPVIERITDDLDETKDQEPSFEESEEASEQPAPTLELPASMPSRKPKFNLKDPPVVKYSPLEKGAFYWISLHHPTPQTTTDIALGVLSNSEGMEDPPAAILNVLKGLQRKLIFNGEPFALKFSRRRGPNPATVSIEKVKRYAPKNQIRLRRNA